MSEPAPTATPAPASGAAPAPPPAPLASSAPLPPTHGGGPFSPKVRLVVAATLLVAWLGWLIVTALTKNHGPIVSRSQAAVAKYVVLAELEPGPTGGADGKAKVVEVLAGDGPPAGAELRVVNIADADGLGGPGRYLLLLSPEPEGAFAPPADPTLPRFVVTPIPRPSDGDLTRGPKPRVYPWRDDLRKQVKALWPDGK